MCQIHNEDSEDYVDTYAVPIALQAFEGEENEEGEKEKQEREGHEDVGDYLHVDQWWEEGLQDKETNNKLTVRTWLNEFQQIMASIKFNFFWIFCICSKHKW